MSFDFNHDGSTSHQESAAGFLIVAMSTIIIAISAITTYGFFSAYFPGIVPVDLVGPMYSKMLSGLIGVICFDLAVVVWLTAFLRNAETPEQRAIALVMTFFSFTVSAIASAAHLYMSAIGSMAQDAATLTSLRNVSMVAVVLGVVVNFGAWTLYGRYSYASKQRVREADRRDGVQKAESQQASYLDMLVAQQVKEVLEREAPELARLQAGRIANSFANRERAKYHTGTPAQRSPVPAELPTTLPTREPVQNGNGANFTPRPGNGR